MGCVQIHNMMEDAAADEMRRAQIWQWIEHHAELQTGESVTDQMVSNGTAAELDRSDISRLGLADVIVQRDEEVGLRRDRPGRQFSRL